MMKEENEINEEVKELLESLEQHGRNARRQRELSDLIDDLAAGTSLRAERRRLYPMWWIAGAAAACLLLWLLARPSLKEAPNAEEQPYAQEIETISTPETKPETKEESIFEEPVKVEEYLAKEKPSAPKKTPKETQKKTPQKTEKFIAPNIVEPIVEEQLLAETNLTENTDTSNNESNTIPIENKEKLSTVNCQLPTNSTPQRRVIRSLNLVCYECQKEPDYNSKFLILNSQLDKTIFGQPQDPNMKNGSLAIEVKLY